MYVSCISLVKSVILYDGEGKCITKARIMFTVCTSLVFHLSTTWKKERIDLPTVRPFFEGIVPHFGFSKVKKTDFFLEISMKAILTEIKQILLTIFTSAFSLVVHDIFGHAKFTGILPKPQLA